MGTINFSKAEQKARQRDLEIQKVLSDEELAEANRLQTKAGNRGMILIPEKKIKNKAKFAQFIQQNWGYLRGIKYLTTEEKSFLIDLVPNIGFLSNCIVDDVNKKNPRPLTQTDISTLLGTSKTKVSRVVKNLIDKGIIARAESGLVDNNVRSYALFVNPNVIFSGNKDEINLTLKAMFQKTNKILGNIPERLC